MKILSQNNTATYLDLFNLYSQPDYDPTKISTFEHDKQALASDWQIVGETLRDLIQKNIKDKNAE